MVDDAVDHHPLGLDAVAVEALLHGGVLGVLSLPLLALQLLVPRAVVVGRRLVHVVLALVVSVHHRVVQLQLRGAERRTDVSQRAGFRAGALKIITHLTGFQDREC